MRVCRAFVGASEVRTAPDAHNTLKHVCDDVFSLFEKLDGIWSPFMLLRCAEKRTKHAKQCSSSLC
jgi:hypothetical protein